MICTYCSKDAAMFCRSHGKYVCGEMTCMRLHRWDRTELCELYSPDVARDWIDRVDWMEIVLAAGTLMVASTLIVMIFAHRGGQ